ncbi:hypothetical protein ACFL0S_04725 [Thermodesulfobacteriota bacterium]
MNSLENLLLGCQNIAVVCHDAGAANIIIHALLENDRKDWQAFMQGPAKRIWHEAFPEVMLVESLESCLEGASALISGTGWASDIEFNARKLAQETGTYSIAVIDHWINYSDRFIRDNEIILPDEFWVTDRYASNLARQTFPGENIRLIPNYYTSKQLEGISQIKSSDDQNLLYLLEPIRADWRMIIPGEFQALDYFISKMPLLNLPIDTKIVLRQHPSDPKNKYDEWISNHHVLDITLEAEISLSKLIAHASWVVGCESFALALASMAGKQCFCSLPPWAPDCRLPFKNIIKIKDL